ncbi:MAG TPA: sulfite dehydrogenase, partial [Fibrella sp.]
MNYDKPQPTQPQKITRRNLLGGAMAVAVVQTSFAKGLQIGIPDDPTKQMGVPPGKVGTRSPFEKLAKSPSDISSRSPLQDFQGMITPADLHFERHHNGVPTIDPATYALTIHGFVDRP